MNPALRSVHSWRKSPVWSFKSSYRPTCLPSVSVVCCFARLLEIYPVPSLPIPWRGGFLFLTYPYTAFGPRGLSVCEREPCLQGPMHQTSTGLSPLLHTHTHTASKPPFKSSESSLRSLALRERRECVGRHTLPYRAFAFMAALSFSGPRSH